MFLRRCVLFLGLILCIFLLINAQTIVRTVPGYPGNLPFKLETGYVSVGENDSVQLFYYFVESERDPVRDPLVLWLTGGPGCSAFSGLVYEIGPLLFDAESFNGTTPSFLLNPYSWTKIANIIFLDLPVGTGFSYATNSQGYYSSDTKSTKDAHMFLQKWLLNHPKFIKNRLYIAGDSYAGKLVPMIVLDISKGNEAGLIPTMSIEGYLLGNPAMNVQRDLNWRVPYAHRFALISDEYYEQAKRSCHGEFFNPNPNNTECLFALQLVNECISHLCMSHILEPTCKFRASITDGLKWDQTFLEEDSIEILFSSSSNQERPQCRFNDYLLSYVWMNDPTVRQALQVREGTKAVWKRCNQSLSYDMDVPNVFHYHQVLSRKGYQALIYSGDHDMMVPYLGTLEWIRNLNLTLGDDWRPWFFKGQIAGYTLMYQSEGDKYSYLTFATVKGAGHTAPEYKPKECFAMIERWFSNYFL